MTMRSRAIGILGIMALHLIARWRAAKLAPAADETPPAEHPGWIDRYGLYLLVILMVGTGYGIAIPANLPAVVFVGTGEPLPANFGAYPAFWVHSLLAALLVALIVRHVRSARRKRADARDR